MGITSIKEPSKNALLGLWHITETPEELILNLDLSSYETEIYKTKKTDSRKKEWLACRSLIHKMLNNKVEIQYNPNGKPFLTSNDYYISMSHSGEYACVYLDRFKPVGVDIQKLKSSLIAGVDFFINTIENKWISLNDNAMLHVIWSAKETVFKYCGINELDVKKDIVVKPFKSNENGIIEVNILNHQPNILIMVYYHVFEGYVLTHTI